jgi:parvulin-like peptidyl-prolyl isomerase
MTTPDTRPGVHREKRERTTVKRVLRATLLPAALLAAVTGLSGCRTSPGAAAIVGDDRISTATLQDEVARALADPKARQALGDRTSFTRTELGRLINNSIIASAAARRHITATSAEIETQINEFAAQAGGMPQLQQQAAESGIPKAELRDFIRYYVLQQKIGDQLVADVPVSKDDLKAAYQQNIDRYDVVHAAHILVDSKSLADRILAQARANPDGFADLAARYSIDTGSKASGGDLGTQPKSQFVPEFGDPVFAAKPGTFIEVHSQFGWHVVHVISHTRTPLSKVSDELKASVLQNSHDQLLAQALNAESKRIGVHVNPRYGRWDATQGTVVPLKGSDSVSSPSPAPPGGAGQLTPAG